MSGHGSFIWYELMTRDPQAAADFYGTVVGWQIAAHGAPTAGDIDYRMITRRDGGHAGGVLVLSKPMLEHGARPCWLGYLQVDDVDTTVSAMIAAGAALQMPAMDLPVGRIAMLCDPQGAPFYVMKPIPPPGKEGAVSDVFSHHAAQHVRWNELTTSDPLAAIAFYTHHFGWTQEGDMDMGEIGKYRFLQHQGAPVGAVMPRTPDMPVSAWQYYIGVDDIDRAVTAIEDRRGRVLHRPVDIPGGEFAVNALDPQGAAFGLVGPRAG